MPVPIICLNDEVCQFAERFKGLFALTNTGLFDTLHAQDRGWLRMGLLFLLKVCKR
jgi:hypothetical protein